MAGILHTRCRALRAVTARVGLSLILAAWAVPEARAGDNAPKKFDPAQIRKDLARVRARLEAERKRKGLGSSSASASASRTARDRQAAEMLRNAEKEVRAKVEESTRARSARALSYRLVPGMTFGYSIDIRIARSYKSERFAGTPIFSVRSVEKDDDAVVFVIGKLTCTSILTGSEGEQERPSRTVWIGSLLNVSPSGRVGGKKDYKDTVLPVFLTTLIKPRELFFPELTASITGQRSEERGASLWLKMTPRTVIDTGIKQIEGTEKRVLRARPLSGSLVELRKERSFLGKDKPPTVLRYESTSRIDRARGLMVDSSGSSETEEGPVTISLRLLEGDELKQAVDKANADWVDRPAELDPFELRRVRLDVESLPRLQSPAQARPGMAVAHFRDGDYHWYLAQVVEVVDARQYKVKIRYRGSDEVLEVHPGQLAIAPALKTP